MVYCIWMITWLKYMSNFQIAKAHLQDFPYHLLDFYKDFFDRVLNVSLSTRPYLSQKIPKLSFTLSILFLRSVLFCNISKRSICLKHLFHEKGKKNLEPHVVEIEVPKIFFNKSKCWCFLFSKFCLWNYILTDRMKQYLFFWNFLSNL